jgi:hypothetical protein
MVLTTAGAIAIGYIADNLAKVDLPRALGERYVSTVGSIFHVHPTHKAPGFLSRKLTTPEVLAHYEQFTAAVRDAASAICAAAAEHERTQS